MLGIYAGSFDPLTNGHMEIIRQAAGVFEKVVVLVAANPGKQHWLSIYERKNIVEEAVSGLAEVDILAGVDTSAGYAFRRGGCLVRGLGEFTDYPYEKNLLGINSRLRPEVETVFLMSKSPESQMRSSSVREAIKYPFGWRSIRDAVPRATFNAVALNLLGGRDIWLSRLIEKTDLSRYQSRAYHNLEHLLYMFEMAEIWGGPDRESKLLNLWTAIIYHDLLVDSDPDVNPGQDVSSSLALLDGAGLLEDSRKAVEDLIRVTDHKDFSLVVDKKMTPDQELMAKLDLAVLGETPYEYARYSRAIREEYAPKYGYLSDGFREGRQKFLKTMLNRLQAGPLINEEYDRRMAVNFDWELGQLAQGR